MDRNNLKNPNEIFHVHTYRCKHASDEDDEAYIKRAIQLGATKITFTDHAPFPKNPFGNRMQIEELEEYICTLKTLKEQYKAAIEVNIGLEIEYLPSFYEYYKWLYQSEKFDILMIGQHFYECGEQEYSFSLPPEVVKREEAEGLCHAVVEGMQSGFFQAVAHPDRIFRRCKGWNTKMEKLSKEIIRIAEENNIMLERNLSSLKKKNQHRKEFWEIVPCSQNTIIGIDAHSVDELSLLLEVDNPIYKKEVFPNQ